MRQMPRTGDLVRVRSRRWLVEDAPTIEGLATTRLACVDDDAQGEVSISLPSGAQSSLRSRLKDFLRHRRGVATKYLGSYLRVPSHRTWQRPDTSGLPQRSHRTATQDECAKLIRIEPKSMQVKPTLPQDVPPLSTRYTSIRTAISTAVLRGFGSACNGLNS